MNIERGLIHWFIHKVDRTPLGFIRLTNGGAAVLGGKTGSHITGHGVTYRKKLNEIKALGYMPVEIAMELRLVAPTWSPPEIRSPIERDWLEKIERNEM